MSNERKTKGRATEIDVIVGKRVREIRQAQGISQEKLGEAIGITFQQVQKYERGTNRISAGKLFEMSKFFNKPLEAFFDGAE